jgi:hypothetical protein
MSLFYLNTVEICEAIEYENAVAEDSGWAAFFSTRGAVHRLMICILVGFMIQWAGNGMLIFPPSH